MLKKEPPGAVKAPGGSLIYAQYADQTLPFESVCVQFTTA